MPVSLPNCQRGPRAGIARNRATAAHIRQTAAAAHPRLEDACTPALFPTLFPVHQIAPFHRAGAVVQRRNRRQQADRISLSDVLFIPTEENTSIFTTSHA